MKNFLFIILALFTFNANARECSFQKKWQIETSAGKKCLADTRHFILYARGEKVEVNSKCVVISGEWESFYSGKKIYNPKDIEIDHVLPWHELQLRGATRLDKENMCQLYNDLQNLVIATSKENGIKNDWVYKSISPEKIHTKTLKLKLSDKKLFEVKQKSRVMCSEWGLDECSDFE